MIAEEEPESSSESDEEESRRLQEAAVEFNNNCKDSTKQNGNASSTLSDKQTTPLNVTNKISKRQNKDVRDDANELNTTPEFRYFVAKKLGSYLDSAIKCVKQQQEERSTNETSLSGFRLFSSSCGNWVTEEDLERKERRKLKKQRKKRRKSSDSSSEDGRLMEAAVTTDVIFKSDVKDLNTEHNTPVDLYTSLKNTDNKPENIAKLQDNDTDKSTKSKKCKHKNKDKTLHQNDEDV